MPADPLRSTCGWMIKRCIFPDAEAVASAFADAILHQFDSARHTRQGPIGLMLPGGRTPKAAYMKVAASHRAIPPDVHLLLSDERHVPLDHPDSNYHMMTPFMDAVGATLEQRLMVRTELPRAEAAADFGRRLGDFFEQGGTLDTCFLGLGADGHTASLFSEEHLKASEGKNAIDVDRPDGRVGISATPSIFQRARRVVFVVTGADKKEMADQLVRHPLSIIAGQAVYPHARVELWMDRDAVA